MRMMLLAAMFALALSAGKAKAEPFSTAISVFFAASSAGAGFGAALAAGFGVITSTFVGKLVVGVGLSLLGQLFTNKKQPSIRQRGIQTEQTTTGDTTPQKFVVGRYGLEGHAVAPAYSRLDNNKVLTYVLEVSNVPVKGLTGRVIIDGQYTDLSEPDAANENRLNLLDFANAGSPGDFFGWMWFYDGRQTTASAPMVSRYSAHPDRPWTTDHKLLGTAYAVLEFFYDREIFPGLPSVRFEVEGIALYDPRKDTSVGGSGAHRWNDTDTWEYSDNPMVIAYNVLRGIPMPTGDIYGGDVPAEDLPLDSWFPAMNECDVLIGSRPQYRAGFEINTNETEPAEVIEEMLRACFGQISEFGGVFRVRVGAPSSPVMSLTDEDFMITEPSRYDPFPGLANTYNAVTGTYVEPGDVWEGRSADAITNAQWEADDGGRRLTAELNLPSVSNKSQAQQLLTAYIKDQRRFRTHRMVLPPTFALLEPLDTISWTSDVNGYVNKLFEIIRVEHRADTLNQSVYVREREPGDVFWESGDDVPAPSPFLGLTPPNVLTPTLTVTGDPILDADGVARRASILIEWPPTEAPDDAGLKYEVRLLGDVTGELVASNTVTAGVGQARISDALPDTAYEVRARYVVDLPNAWSAWTPVTTSDTRLSAKDIVNALNEKIDTAFERHDETLTTLTPGGAVFNLLNEVRIEDAILAAQDVTNSARIVVEKEASDEAFADIATEITTRESEDSALASQITTVQASVDGNAAAIVTEQTARADGDSALAQNITSLAATVDGNTGAIVTEQTARANGDSALSQQITALTAEVDDNAAAVVTEQTARANGDSAIASDVTALTSRVGDNESNISDIQTVKVDANGAIAAVETEISATYNGLTAMASATGFAEATADKIEAGYVWRLNNQNLIELVSVQDGVDTGPTSTFRIDADYVQITGLTQIDQAVINNLAVDNGFISNLEVDTLNVAGEAITAPQFTSSASTLTGNGQLQPAMIGAIDVPANTTANFLVVVSFAQGYPNLETNPVPRWGFSIEGPANGAVFERYQPPMGAVNDYPTVSFIGTVTNTSSTQSAKSVVVKWYGENSDIELGSSSTISILARWR